jgi:hypothetical protein
MSISSREALRRLQQHGLVMIENNNISVTELGVKAGVTINLHTFSFPEWAIINGSFEPNKLWERYLPTIPHEFFKSDNERIKKATAEEMEFFHKMIDNADESPEMLTYRVTRYGVKIVISAEIDK